MACGAGAESRVVGAADTGTSNGGRGASVAVYLPDVSPRPPGTKSADDGRFSSSKAKVRLHGDDGRDRYIKAEVNGHNFDGRKQ